MDVTFALDDDNYSILTSALTEYADEREFRAIEGGPHADSFRSDAARARNMLELIEDALDAS